MKPAPAFAVYTCVRSTQPSETRADRAQPHTTATPCSSGQGSPARQAVSGGQLANHRAAQQQPPPPPPQPQPQPRPPGPPSPSAASLPADPQAPRSRSPPPHCSVQPERTRLAGDSCPRRLLPSGGTAAAAQCERAAAAALGTAGARRHCRPQLATRGTAAAGSARAAGARGGSAQRERAARARSHQAPVDERRSWLVESDEWCSSTDSTDGGGGPAVRNAAPRRAARQRRRFGCDSCQLILLQHCRNSAAVPVAGARRRQRHFNSGPSASLPSNLPASVPCLP